MSTTFVAPSQGASLPDPDELLRRLEINARGLFEIFVLGRREDDRTRIGSRLDVVVGPGDQVPASLSAGDLLVRGAMGEGFATLSVLVTGELLDVSEAAGHDLELEGRLPGRYAWVVEAGSSPHTRDDRFARRVADRRGFLLQDHVVLHATEETPRGESFAEDTPSASADIRIRKNVTALSPAERRAYCDAVLELKRRRIYHDFVRDHANSMQTAHRQPAFFPWHRQFLLIFESELRRINPSVTIPYWDWSRDPGRDSSGNKTWNATMVAMFGGNGSGPAQVVTTGPFKDWTMVDVNGNDTSQPLQRAFGALSIGPALSTEAHVSNALAITPFDVSPWDDSPTTAGFRNEVEGWRHQTLHNLTHIWVGGSMLPGTSPNDPCFFVHHCFIDKIWADWQSSHPSLTYEPATRQARPSNPPAWGLRDDVPVWHVTTSSPTTYKAIDTLDLRNLKDHRGATGIQVRYV